MIEYRPIMLRGFKNLQVWSVYVDNRTDRLPLTEIKRQLNNPPVRGVVFIENESKAIKRMKWEKFDDGIYYKIFR